jgi:hypothetical protein
LNVAGGRAPSSSVGTGQSPQNCQVVLVFSCSLSIGARMMRRISSVMTWTPLLVTANSPILPMTPACADELALVEVLLLDPALAGADGPAQLDARAVRDLEAVRVAVDRVRVARLTAGASLFR